MTSEQSRGPALPAGADDFKLIHGIGPGIASRLHNAGISRFEELAARTPEQIALIVADIAGMSAERIVKQDWIGQAQEFSNQPAIGQLAADQSSLLRQHYATFTIELLLDEHNDVRRTRAMHVQSGIKTTWAGWDQGRISAFLIEQSGLVDGADSDALSIEAAEPQAGANLVLASAAVGRKFIERGEAFGVCLGLDLARARHRKGAPMHYTATIFARELGGQRNVIGEDCGLLVCDDQATVAVQSNLPQPGVYRIEACVTIADPAGDAAIQQPLTAQIEGDLVSVW